jgi:hypothetical protein
LNDDRSVNVSGIFDRVVISGPPFRFKALLLAKLAINPAESGTVIKVTVTVSELGGSNVVLADTDYRVPDLRTILHTNQLMSLNIDRSLPRAGEHVVEIAFDGAFKAAEMFDLEKDEE